MNYDKIEKNFQKMTTDTQKLVDKYNESVSKIKSQEQAITRLREQISAIKKGDINPPSIEKMLTQLIKNSTELEKIDSQINAISSKSVTTTAEDRELVKLKANRKILEDILATTREEIGLERESNPVIDELNNKIDTMNNKLQENKETASDLKDEIEDSMNEKSVINFGEKISEVSNKIDKFKNRISRLIIGTFVFNTLRSSLSSLKNSFFGMLQTNNQFASSLNQIKANLVTAFVPIYNACIPAINALMNTLSKITGTIAIFVNNLFGSSIKDATKDAKKLTGALNKTSKSAKKASGSLASFDTLEVLPDSSNTGSISSGTTDNSGIDYNGEIQYSQKLLDTMMNIYNWIVKNKDELITFGEVLIGAFAVYKTLTIIGFIEQLNEKISKASGLFVKVGEDGSKSLNKVGIGATIAIAGFGLLLKNVSGLITHWDELSTKQKLIKAGMAILGAAAIALGIAIATGISTATLGLGALIALIATAVTAVLSFIAKLVTEKDAILSTKDAQDQLNQAKQDYINANESYIDALDRSDTALKELRDAEKQTGLSGEKLYQSVQNGTLDYSNMTSAQKQVYKAYLENQKAQDNLTKATETLSAAKKAETDASFANQLAIAAESGNYEEYKKSVIEAYKNGTLSAEDARDKLEQAMSRMSDKSQETFMKDIPGNIKNGMDPDKYQTTWQKMKNGVVTGLGKVGEAIKKFFTKTVPNLVLGALESLINAFISMFEGMINKPIKAINKLINTANKIPGVDISKFTEVKLGRISMPRLATGAVIPPRQEFAAILGDQKHGTNIEAPLETLKQANREVLEEVLNRIGIDGQAKEIVLRNWQFILQFGDTKFGKLVIDEIKKYQDETGTQFLLA